MVIIKKKKSRCKWLIINYPWIHKFFWQASELVNSEGKHTCLNPLLFWNYKIETIPLKYKTNTPNLLLFSCVSFVWKKVYGKWKTPNRTSRRDPPTNRPDHCDYPATNDNHRDQIHRLYLFFLFINLSLTTKCLVWERLFFFWKLGKFEKLVEKYYYQ